MQEATILLYLTILWVENLGISVLWLVSLGDFDSVWANLEYSRQLYLHIWSLDSLSWVPLFLQAVSGPCCMVSPLG